MPGAESAALFGFMTVALLAIQASRRNARPIVLGVRPQLPQV